MDKTLIFNRDIFKSENKIKKINHKNALMAFYYRALKSFKITFRT